ncbi:MAG: hypothetical protein R6U92_07165 [Bacillota bacterium]
MKIDLSREEYVRLVEMLYLAKWMLDSYIGGGTPKELRPYADLEQKIMAQAKRFDVGEDMIEWVPKLDGYFHTRKFEVEGEIFERIEAYDASTVWEELPYWLARRDLLERYGGDIDDLDEEEVDTSYYNLVARYKLEFLKNGIDNLRLCSEKETGEN